MSHIDKTAWRQLREQGKSRFILRGMVPRGFKIATACTMGFLLASLLANTVTSPAAESIWLVKTFIVTTLLAGWLEGALSWSKNERDLEMAMVRQRIRR